VRHTAFAVAISPFHQRLRDQVETILSLPPILTCQQALVIMQPKWEKEKRHATKGLSMHQASKTLFRLDDA
jgi:hypothetical protein